MGPGARGRRGRSWRRGAAADEGAFDDDFLDGGGEAASAGGADEDGFDEDEGYDEDDVRPSAKRKKGKRRGRRRKDEEEEEEDFDESLGVGTLTGGELKSNRTAASRHSTPRLHSHITWYEKYSRMDALGKQAYNVRGEPLSPPARPRRPGPRRARRR